MDLRHPLPSPVYADPHGLPPLLIHVGRDEILLSDSERLAERAKAAGVDATLEVWEHMWHDWHTFAAFGVPEARQALDRVGLFLREHLGRAAPAFLERNSASVL